MAITGEMHTLMQKLPQELYDTIYEYVFTAAPGERIIDEACKPPIQLQVDSASRELFAKSFYGNGSTFTFPHGLARRGSKGSNATGSGTRETIRNRPQADRSGGSGVTRALRRHHDVQSALVIREVDERFFTSIPASHFAMIKSIGCRFPTSPRRHGMIFNEFGFRVWYQMQQSQAFAVLLGCTRSDAVQFALPDLQPGVTGLDWKIRKVEPSDTGVFFERLEGTQGLRKHAADSLWSQLGGSNWW